MFFVRCSERKNSYTMEKKTRSEFLRTAGAFTLFSAFGVTLSSCGNGTNSIAGPSDDNESAVTVTGNIVTVDLTDDYFGALKNEGGMAFSQKGGFLAVNVDGTIIRAFTNVCTHSGCNNQWSLTGTTFVCNCHGSVFNTSGQPTSGPANSNLTEYRVSRDGDTLTITR